MTKSTEFKFAALLSKINQTADELHELHQFLQELSADVNGQQTFFDYCSNWKLAPWIYVQLKQHHLLHYLNTTVSQKFEESHEKILRANEKRNQAACLFLKEFEKENIDVIILKGNLFTQTVYNDFGYKRMNDFDILIHLEDWDRIQDIYMRLGFIPLGFGWSGEKEKPAKFSHIGMSFISPDFSCIVGSQWGLKSPTAEFKVPIDEAWKTAENHLFYGIRVKKMSPEFNLLHLILHMGVFKCGIRDCMDVYNLVLTHPINETHLLNLIRQAGAEQKAHYTFSLTNLCVPVFTDSLLEKLHQKKSGFLHRRLTKRFRIAGITGDFQTSYNDYFQDIEKLVIYFNLFPAFHKKLVLYLKIIGAIYFPKKAVCLKLADQPQNASFFTTLWARMKAPCMVFSLIAQEIGWKFTILLFVKLIVDLLISLKNYFVKSESYFDYLKKRGIDPKEIEKTVKNIQ
ncbi:MAG: nucleotidyltransferase family protein [Bacteroidetes bacterium]|nr:nucleotidyltransferase family protein [Bacteroidota bacterium]